MVQAHRLDIRYRICFNIGIGGAVSDRCSATEKRLVNWLPVIFVLLKWATSLTTNYKDVCTGQGCVGDCWGFIAFSKISWFLSFNYKKMKTKNRNRNAIITRVADNNEMYQDLQSHLQCLTFILLFILIFVHRLEQKKYSGDPAIIIIVLVNI